MFARFRACRRKHIPALYSVTAQPPLTSLADLAFTLPATPARLKVLFSALWHSACEHNVVQCLQAPCVRGL
jgi:hypothetical protein